MMKIGNLYGSVTRNSKELWKLIWDISFKAPSALVDLAEIMIKDSLIKLLYELKPGLIISVHPLFNGSVLNILEERNLKIPFLAVIPDLVSITPLWADSRADYTICPTIEAKNRCIEFGLPEHKLKVTGFPVRGKFRLMQENPDRRLLGTSGGEISFLIMSGGEGSGNMNKIARTLLDNFNCKVQIITGRNALLKKKLENTLLDRYSDKVSVYGFVDNIQDLLAASDILLARGSPNVMMEAVMCNVPLIITGALPGQEEGNPAFVLKHNLGVVCTGIKDLKKTVSSLMENNMEKLEQIRISQRLYRNPDASHNIAELAISLIRDECVVFSGTPDDVSKPKRLKSLILKESRNYVKKRGGSILSERKK
jgi:processive 1,2-diacylglycerol beta-glucosyltransferase